MTHLFSNANRRRLELFARANVLLAFDFDGTLAPIVSSPAAAVMRPSTRKLITRIARLYPSVVISGRAERDARLRLRGVPLCRVLGNHGAEPSPAASDMRRQVRRWLPLIRARLSSYAGIVVEDKGVSVAVHYRDARKRNEGRRAVLAVARSLDDVRIVGGTLVVNLLLPDAPHKGVALERERRRLACDAAVYVGDDETDEDVFRSDGPRLLSVRVGKSRASRADCYIRNQGEIDRLLRTLASMRDGHGE